ncbi:MAG: hypothetical protein GY822_27030, partial [Deltaproteobacteria bacterium]|nr:hypothetical protein [Deltaproteobacteria bacterium]
MGSDDMVGTVCVAMEVVAEGDECDLLANTGTETRICRGSLLSRELFCDASEADPLVGTCTATKAAGEACIFSFGCQSELECSDDEVCAETPPECVVDADCS